MPKSRIRTFAYRDEPTPKHIFTDHDWIRHHQDELVAQYGECFMVVYHEKVLGTGRTREEAVENAEHNLPPEIDEIQVMVEWVDRPSPRIGSLFRVIESKPDKDDQ